MTTETKTKTAPAANDAFQSANEIGKRAFKAYFDASLEINAAMDKIARLQASHASQASKDAAELMSSAIETGIRARESARKASMELVETAFAGR